MTDREVMQQALEALELEATRTPIPETAAAMHALRTALAEPEPEPVAFRWKVKINDVDGWVVGHNEPPPYAIEQQPLYTAPFTRRPLTDEEIGAMWRNAVMAGHPYDSPQHFSLAFARAIERKITGGNDE